MRIQICPIKRLYQILSEDTKEASAAILSSASEVNHGKLQGIPYVFRQYEDLDFDCPGRSFTQEDAAAFADFLREQESHIDTLYCCCDAGESRSPAVAAAFMRHLGMDDMPIWQNPRYHPNMLVFVLLTEALGMPVSDEEIDFLLYTSQKAFRDAISR